MKKYLLILTLFSTMLASNAYAEIYKHVDADGRVTYSNIKTKGAAQLDIDPDANVIKNSPPRTSNSSSNNKRTATPSDFPKVDKETQSNRDGKRQDILQSELNAEKTALEQAKKAYADGEANPEMVHHANGKTFRNVAKFQEKMKSLKADVDGHENNIKLLEKELAALK